MTPSVARRWLALALLVHVVLAGTWAFRAPAWEGPDENDHAWYANYLAATGRQPTILQSGVTTGRLPQDEAPLGHHPPLYYLLLAGGTRLWTGTDHSPYWSPDPTFPAAACKWKHGFDERAPVSAEITVLRGQRLFSVLLGAASIALTFALGRAVFPARPAAAAGGALALACLPQWSWMHGVLDNGNLATTLAMAVLVVLARALRARRLGLREGTVLGVLLGAALLTKLTALFLLPVVALAHGIAVVAWRDARARVLASAALAGGIAAAASGWWFWRNHALYGDALALAPHAVAYATNRVADADRWTWILGDFLPRTLQSTFAGIGWALRRAPAVAEAACGLVAVVALLGFVRRLRPLAREGGAPLAVAAAASALTFAGLVQFNLGFYQPQGRYLFPGLGVVSVALAAGGAALPAARVVGPLLAAAGIAGAFALQHAVFLPMLSPQPVDDPLYASYHAGLRSPAPAAQRTLVVEAPADGARLDAPPAFAWRDPDGGEGDRYSVILGFPSGLTMATFESAGVALAAGTWTMPEAWWASLPADEPIRWRVRRIPDRARGEAARAQPESPERTFVRVR